MPKFLIERQLPGAGAIPADQLQEISKKSVGVLTDMGPSIQWVQSYVTPDALFCVYIAPNEEAIREHGRRGRFPVTQHHPHHEHHRPHDRRRPSPRRSTPRPSTSSAPAADRAPAARAPSSSPRTGPRYPPHGGWR